VICSASFEQRLVDTPTTSNNTDNSACTARDSFLCAGWKTDACFVLIGRVTNDGGIVSRGTRECTTVAKFLLNVADNGTFRTCRDREDIANSKLSLLSCIYKGTRVKALCCDKGLLSKLVTVGVTENDTGKWGTTNAFYKLGSCRRIDMKRTGRRRG
jgi:hypothetical protein